MQDVAQLRIEAAHKKVAEVFSKDYSFTIPAYQRPYAWETTQVEELLTDLSDAMGPESRSDGFYFLGSIVLVKTHGSPDSRVVDGQQRLTTLTILFSLIRDWTEDPVKQASRETYQASRQRGRRHPRSVAASTQAEGPSVFFEKHVQTRGATESLPSTDGHSGAKARIIENATTIRAKLVAMGEDKRSELLPFCDRHPQGRPS